MATIATALLPRKKEQPDDEQLLKLFRNRAELKKELASLRREKDKLLEQIRQQEGVNLRSQQRLEQLENLLADPLQAANALVYYQLRGVWQHCRNRLARLGRELTDRQCEREQQHITARFDEARDAAINAIDEKLTGLIQRSRAMEEDLRTGQDRVRQLRGFWNYFRRRALRDHAEVIRASLEGLQAQIQRLEANRREKEQETPPQPEGLSVEGKRNINLAIIAMAQQLLVQFTEHDVAVLAREASVRALTDVSYGSAADCRAVSQVIESVMRTLDPLEQMNGRVRRRAEFLRLTAHYRRDADTVPVAGSFADIPLQLAEAGEPRPVNARALSVNVLADEYWDIYTILLN